MNQLMNFLRFLLFGILLMALLLSCQQQQKEPVKEENNAVKLFSLVTANHSGLDFSNDLPENRLMNILAYQYYYNGGGVAIGDINNDSLPDVFFTGNIVPNKLYLNQGNLQFQDITESAGIVSSSKVKWDTGTNMVDINHDGYLDIYVCRSGNLQPENRRNLLYINMGDNTFIESASVYGLDDPGYSIQSAFFDYDQDGDLDMFLINHGINYYGRDRVSGQEGIVQYSYDKLYQNDAGYFRDVSEAAGILTRPSSFGLGLGIGDLNNDGWDDIYVSNDFFEHDYLYLNKGDGTFQESIKSTTEQISYFGMGNDLSDINNDGLLDIMVVDMAAEDHERRMTNLEGISYEKFHEFLDKGYHRQYMFNSLNLNDGMGGFSNIAHMTGMGSTDWSWAPLMADFDNDEDKDVYITNGLRKDVLNLDFINSISKRYSRVNNPNEEISDAQYQQMLAEMPSQKIQNYLYENMGAYQFVNNAGQMGLTQLSFSNGAAYADLDRDGDLDLLVNNIDEKVFLYKNNTNQKDAAKYLRIHLKQETENISAIGAKVQLFYAGKKQYQQFFPVRGYQSSMEPVLHFGLGTHAKVDSIRIQWPDQTWQMLYNIATNQTLHIQKEAQELYKEHPASDKQDDVIFSDITKDARISFKHHENDFNDYKYQYLLPHKMSEEGPALAVADVNRDGLDDFYIGGSKGYSGKLFLQGNDLQFRSIDQAIWQADKNSEDTGAAFFDCDQDGDLDLYVVSGGFEFEKNDPLLQDRLYLNDGKGHFSKSRDRIPSVSISGSCVIPADYDEDGDPDLFIGGRQIPDQYPLPASSMILNNEEGYFKDVTAQIAPQLQELGMTTDAVWADLDQDQDLDLALVGEWMPVTVFINQENAFQMADIPELVNTRGWYFSLATSDVDGDGDLDLVAGNAGLNHRFKSPTNQSIEIFVHDFDQNQDIDPVLAYNFDNHLYPFNSRNMLFGQMPFIKKKYPDYAPYATATMPEIFSQQALDTAIHYIAHNFSSICLLNGGDGSFTIKPLPMEAQMFNINDIMVIDYNQDQIDDLLIAGNLYGVEYMSPRIDAGHGLLLQGIGDGEFAAISPQRSGFYTPGYVKHLALLKSQGAPIIVVAKNDDYLQFIKRNSLPPIAF